MSEFETFKKVRINEGIEKLKVEGCPLCWPGSEGDLLTQNYVLTEWPG